MKRSPLNRKTPLNRGTKQLKRTPLKRTSKKKHKELNNDERKAWGNEFDWCFVCGWRAGTWHAKGPTMAVLDTHEVQGGGLRFKAVQEPSMWLRACRWCHEEVLHRYSGRAGLIEQLKIKQRCDPTRFDLEAVNRVVVNKYAPIKESEL